NCLHCYINLPANDQEARSQELSFEEIRSIVDEAVEMGCLWWLITGGVKDHIVILFFYLLHQ
ncbi:unnamed protein product, partial [marine sediment metagenome]